MTKEDLVKLAEVDFYKELSSRIKFENGLPYWADYPARSKKRKGNLAGTIILGYRKIGITIKGTRKRISAHKLQWFKHFNIIPNMEIDHINNNPDDNRIQNLRLATSSQNKRNTKKIGKSKFTGVCPSRGKWMASIRINGVKKFLARFECESCAAIAYDNAAKEYNVDDFAKLNFPALEAQDGK